ncbi:MAG: creatininase [Verrucomicrobia bacterium RIFCSPLOWO2_12_FULL_64_8]|nr:MAG: creatininase [Verrucomicrobia bacterium RIFCSPLOWO2_12_FULL_64_8]
MSPGFPTYRERYLPAMTPARIAALPDKAWAPVIVATGAIEQHGPHLPVAVDALMGQIWLAAALARLPADASCYVAPPITIGKSNEHTGFPGTLSISKDTLRALLLAIAQQVRDWGFRQLAILNTHGGNSTVVTSTLAEISHTLGLRTAFLRTELQLDISPREAAYGIHAGEVETSWMLAAAGTLVRMDRAVAEYPADLGDPGGLRPGDAPATFAWATRDLSRSGVMGDATAATVEKGLRWIELGAQRYAALIAQLCHEGRKLADRPETRLPA